MEWMRCNACWRLKAEEKHSSLFHLTQCGHVYCEKCIMKAEKQCFQCSSVGTISLPLEEPLSPQISHYFTPPKDLLEKVLQAEQFQESQMALCLKRADAIETKYQSLKEAYWASAENFKKVLEKYNKLKAIVKVFKKEQKKSFASSKMYTPSPSHFGTPSPNQVNNPMCSQQSHYSNIATDSTRRNNEVFKVPSAPRVPRSAGYFSGSSSSTISSNYRMATRQSNYSRY